MDIVNCKLSCKEPNVTGSEVCCYQCIKYEVCINVCTNTNCEIFKVDDYIVNFVEEVKELCNNNEIELEIYKYVGLKYYIFKLTKANKNVNVGFSEFSLEYISKDILKNIIYEKIKELYDSISSQT